MVAGTVETVIARDEDYNRTGRSRTSEKIVLCGVEENGLVLRSFRVVSRAVLYGCMDGLGLAGLWAFLTSCRLTRCSEQ